MVRRALSRQRQYRDVGVWLNLSSTVLKPPFCDGGVAGMSLHMSFIELHRVYVSMRKCLPYFFLFIICLRPHHTECLSAYREHKLEQNKHTFKWRCTHTCFNTSMKNTTQDNSCNRVISSHAATLTRPRANKNCELWPDTLYLVCSLVG